LFFIAHAEFTEYMLALTPTLLKRQVQLQKQQQKQLPADQQAELDNSCNVLGLAVLKLWQHIAHAVIVHQDDVQSTAGAAEWCTPSQNACVKLDPHIMGFSRLADEYLSSWLPAEASAGSSSAGGPTSSSSSSSSVRDMVRYVKVLLPKLQLVRHTDALPAALVTAQEVVRCIDAAHTWSQEASRFWGPIKVWVGDCRVLQQQLLLLAFQAKLLRAEQGLVSCVALSAAGR
jgi:hypothetical protein